MHQRHPEIGAGPRHGARGVAVHHQGCGFLGLGAVNGGPGGGVDHRLGPMGADGCGAGGGIGKIGRIAPQINRLGRHPRQFARDLTGLPENQKPHAVTPSLWPTP